MQVWRIAEELKQLYEYGSLWLLKEITSENVQYVSDFEDIPPLDRTRYEEYLKKQLENFCHPNSLEVLEARVCKKSIEFVLQKDMHSPDHYIYTKKPDFHPFLEPRLLQCKVENGKITEMHLCSPENRKIPDHIQEELLESCRRNDLGAAAAAIRKGAYAGDCHDDRRSCISYAAETGSAELCSLLVEDEADFQFTDWDTIFYAIRNPDIEVLKYLLRQKAPLDVVTQFGNEDPPVTPLDYARQIHNHSAEKMLSEAKAPTFSELKAWFFQTAELRIPLLSNSDASGEMSISAVSDEVNEYAGLHVGHSTLCLWMELEDCTALIIPFFLPYFSKEFEPYLEDNLVTLEDAGKGLHEISDFIAMLEHDFDAPKVSKLLSYRTPRSFILWGKRSSHVSGYFSREEDLLLWKAHRRSLIDFYREFSSKVEEMIEQAKECGDRFISFVGP